MSICSCFYVFNSLFMLFWWTGFFLCLCCFVWAGTCTSEIRVFQIIMKLKCLCAGHQWIDAAGGLDFSN